MSERLIRLSVRQMVEFTLHGEDILPAGTAAMAEGTRAHKARQALSEARTEVPVSWTGQVEGMICTVTGRMDLYDALADPPAIEEIKLLSPYMPVPAEPMAAHRAQAACYAHMLCAGTGIRKVRISVSYVSASGSVRARFDECLDQDMAAEVFFGLLLPIARWEDALAIFRDKRDTSLKAMLFPYTDYRAGQREMAVQAYTAISQKKRLYASLPTGTGKSAAALFPALKALGEGKSEQVFYLTARTTARQAAEDALSLMRGQGMRARTLVLAAKEKQCPRETMRCHPDHCPRAKGHFIRLEAGLYDMMTEDDWSAARVRTTADAHELCPFEFALSLCETADVVVCDYNYVMDPQVYIKRIFERANPVTLLVDEAHNLPSRVRDMLSGALSSRDTAVLRRAYGKLSGRKGPLYRALSLLTRSLCAIPADAAALPDSTLDCADNLKDALSEALEKPQPPGVMEVFRMLLSFLYAARAMRESPQAYRMLVHADGKERQVRLLCLDITTHLAKITKPMNGCVFFSATLSPLESMRCLLGGNDMDACFAMPSPFPPEHFLVLRCDVNTRYRFRESTALAVARAILAMYSARSGKYIAYFPSYAYLMTVRDALLSLDPTLPLHTQERNMTEGTRDTYLDRFRESGGELLGLCVLGGVFAEGVDLPGLALIGAAVVGVGLPQVNAEQEALRSYYDGMLGNGFAYAYRYPGMHKVLQAAGRVIRSETDRGVALLLDDRYGDPEYACLLPPHYRVIPVRGSGEIAVKVQEFWNRRGNIQA